MATKPKYIKRGIRSSALVATESIGISPKNACDNNVSNDLHPSVSRALLSTYLSLVEFSMPERVLS